jgi:hypothetical protein
MKIKRDAERAVENYRIKLTFEDGSQGLMLTDEGGDTFTPAEIEQMRPLISGVRNGTTTIGYNEEFGGLTTLQAWELTLNYDPRDMTLVTGIEVEPVAADLECVAQASPSL